jgi:Zn-dependent metalloprotease
MKIIKNTITVCLFFCISMAIAQKDTTFWNKKMLEIAYKGEHNGWVDIKEEYYFTKNDFFIKTKDAFSLTLKDEMQHVSSTEKDELGYTRHLFQQMYKGIEIEEAQYKLHEKDDRIFCANGFIIQGITCSVEPKITENMALKYALEYIGSKKYAWEIDYIALLENNEEDKENYEKMLRYYEKNSAYNSPKGILLLTRISNNLPMEAENFILAYKFEILAIDPPSSTAIYVCANTGKIFKKHTMEHNNVYEGQALTQYYGYKMIVTSKNFWGNYILEDRARAAFIGTYEGDINNSNVKKNYVDGDNSWSLESERPATTVHWGMGKTYDYFKDVHNRNSFDNQGSDIECYIFDGYSNAKWSSMSIRFLFGNSSNNPNLNPFVSLDLVAHEFTHAINTYTSGLAYEYEPGALNESFSDIFGAVVEFYHLGSAGNYYIGENLVNGGYGMLRSMSNPNSTGQPKTYKGNYWIHKESCSTPILGNDYCGVHTNSGVQNYWFYLLAEGNNSNNTSGYWVDGIGRNKAAQIAYRSLTNGYLTSNSQYIDAAISSMRCAMELYGNCSYEATQVYKAWQAVGINISLNSIPGYNVTPSCESLRILGILLNRVPISATNQITSGCNISSINKPVSFHAGNEIRLLPGFTSNKNFHAYVSSCEQNGSRGESSTAKSLDHDIFFTNDDNEIQSKKNDIITIFPNPNTGSFTIQANNIESITQIQIINPLGQIIYSIQNPTDNNITLPNGAKGTYFVRITTETESVTKKILVE